MKGREGLTYHETKHRCVWGLIPATHRKPPHVHVRRHERNLSQVEAHRTDSAKNSPQRVWSYILTRKRPAQATKWELSGMLWCHSSIISASGAVTHWPDITAGLRGGITYITGFCSVWTGSNRRKSHLASLKLKGEAMWVDVSLKCDLQVPPGNVVLRPEWHVLREVPTFSQRCVLASFIWAQRLEAEREKSSTPREPTNSSSFV